MVQRKQKIQEPAIVKRRVKRVYGIYVDGVSLDRAARRLGGRIDYAALLKSLCPTGVPLIAKYYILLPFEDDSRHRSYLDAVERSGFEVIVKRLPPKNVERQVGIEVEMAADLVHFALASLPPQAETEEKVLRSAVVVCPSLDLTYPLSILKEEGVETTSADFGQIRKGDILKSAAQWIDLSNTPSIWYELPPDEGKQRRG
jgi:hypothetical protein